VRRITMPDRIFFPLAGALVLAMVFLAVQPGIGQLPTGPVAGDGTNYDRLVIDGEYLNKVIAGGEARTRLLRRQGGGYVLQIDAAKDALDVEPELGPHFRLAPDIEMHMSGQRVRVTVRARPADQQPAAQIQVNYSAGRVGQSGWRVFDLKKGSADYSFEYAVPVMSGEQGVDYIGVRPVVNEGRRGVLVEAVIVERLP
jgi:hypothetical protein